MSQQGTRVGALDRRTYIGSSDVAAIIGVHPMRTRLDVYRHKVLGQEQIFDEETQKILKRGQRQEPVILETLCDDEPALVVTRRSTKDQPNRYIDAQYPFMAGEVDFEFRVTPELAQTHPHLEGLINSTQNGEIKSVLPFKMKQYGEMQTDQVPVEHGAQAQYNLGITGRDHCILGAGFGAFNVVRFDICRDDELIEGMRDQVVKFWRDNIEAKVPPEPVNLDDLKWMVSKMNGTPVEVDIDTATKVSQLKAVRSRLTAHAADEEQLQFDIGNAVRLLGGFHSASEIPIDDLSLVFGGRVICTWNAQGGAFLDQKRLKRDDPDLVRRYTERTRVRVMRPK